MAAVDRASVGSSIRGFGAAASNPNCNDGTDHHPSSNFFRRAPVSVLQQNSMMVRSALSQEKSLQKKVEQLHHSGSQLSEAGGRISLDEETQIDRRGATELLRNGEAAREVGSQSDLRDLEELLSKLNPMAEEFIPPSLANHGSFAILYSNNFVLPKGSGRRNKYSYGQGRRRINGRTGLAQREEVIRRTVYVSDIDQQVTEEQLAALFSSCGQVVDCRVCGDPNSVLRFAFVEFTDEEGACAALNLSGTMLGYYPLRVLPSKTAIAPVNPTFLPRSEDEREMCARTIYCTNIDKKVTQADVRHFFESICGEVYRLRLLGDSNHSTRIAFVEFVMAESAIAALSCSGGVLGSLPIRVSPSKTPVRPCTPRPQSTD